MWENFGGMPKLLKFLTAHAAFCIVFLAMSVIPNDSLFIQGRHVGYAEWWSSGAGVFASLIGLVGPFVAWTLVSKKPYARSVYLAFLVLAFVVPYPFFGLLAYVLPGLLVVGAGAFYMYKWQSVQVYFTPNQSFKRTR
ncbi:hypothetical protein [Rhodanobacter lindaniclasticus]|uniref:MFS transporter n=1 Tax=Rhodanobacter lindaniclasticus TaxID=75310 RepID=A0A4S3K6E3_9GAMM|nr:hypothetical protein [Rhodanobacter lindaniclasticus]THD03733.1 hypothetical protein B1991_18195 [Rhodanobacter lindaniclasticus]